MTYEIEKDVPRIPPGSGGLTKYPFFDMEVGDSFFVRCAAEEIPKIKCRLRASARVFRRRYNKAARFELRAVPKGVRCWRFA